MVLLVLGTSVARITFFGRVSDGSVGGHTAGKQQAPSVSFEGAEPHGITPNGITGVRLVIHDVKHTLGLESTLELGLQYGPHLRIYASQMHISV